VVHFSHNYAAIYRLAERNRTSKKHPAESCVLFLTLAIITCPWKENSDDLESSVHSGPLRRRRHKVTKVRDPPKT
jgi:hypothetical protein